jgi:hypothetical protein
LRVQATSPGPMIEVTCDGEEIVSHVGAALLVELADRLALTRALSSRAGQTPRHRHDAGRVLRDFAVMHAAAALRRLPPAVVLSCRIRTRACACTPPVTATALYGIVRQGWMTIVLQHSVRTSSASAAVARSAVAGEGLGTVGGSRRQVAWHVEAALRRQPHPRFHWP